MSMKKLVIKNFKSLKDTTLVFNPHLNLIVGDNETGKSTLLEAINLVLVGQINGRSIQNELTPYLFNIDVVREYLGSLKSGKRVQPPSILIEAYLEDEDWLARLKGTNNSLRENCPGLSLRIEFDEEYSPAYELYIGSGEPLKTLPIEYYKFNWFSFAFDSVTSRTVPIKTTFIDTSILRATHGADRYLAKIFNDVLDDKQRVELALAYRRLKDTFSEDDSVKVINSYLAATKGDITEKDLSVSMDLSSRSAWEASLTPHLDDIPILLTGKGEQSTVNMRLAIETSGKAKILLIEEPENHLSYSNMNKLISKIGEKAIGKQIVIATHSSFVLNKLGVENVILFNRGKSMKLIKLSAETQDYFMKLPGHDTLRLILSRKAILVEGPSDELIVQKAYIKRHGGRPLDHGVDIIAVQSLAFKRFLEIGTLLDLEINVVTDNDGDVGRLENKYREYVAHKKIRVCYDKDTSCPTLEPQLLKANSRELLNKIFDKEFGTDSDLLKFMQNNKTDCALMIFNSTHEIRFPEYIENAISE